MYTECFLSSEEKGWSVPFPVCPLTGLLERKRESEYLGADSLWLFSISFLVSLFGIQLERLPKGVDKGQP